MYNDNRTNAIVWYGGGLDVGYRLWVNSLRTFGIGIEGGMSSYMTKPFFLEYHVGASVIWKGAFK
jgi:hypothetical protein